MNSQAALFENPFRPGAGHTPPYLAGRTSEQNEFRRLLGQSPVTTNLILTGLRGVGKTVLLETFKPIALQAGWHWVGTDLSESASVSEKTLAIRLLTDLSVVSSMLTLRGPASTIGFEQALSPTHLTYEALVEIFESTSGLVTDKLKQVLEEVWGSLSQGQSKGIVFAYDEAQTLSDQAAKEQFPLSTLLELFQSIQRKGIRFMLVLTGLPTLFPKCVEARTFSERMFHVLFLDRLSRPDSERAITQPLSMEACPLKFSPESIKTVVDLSDGYPYFIQFICREAFDVLMQQKRDGLEASAPIDAILRKLDSDFFAGRWARATDRQRDLLELAARLDRTGSEFTVQELVELSERILTKPFSSSHANQMLASLSAAGLVYKNRHGRYSFAVPLLDRFILRQIKTSTPN
jgi:type II secretory pathway predicted ATPase ExeA